MDIAFTNLRLKRTTFGQFLESVRKWYAGIPYSITDKNQNEQFYQSLFYALMVGVGADARPVYAIGLNISSDRRTIENYEIMKL